MYMRDASGITQFTTDDSNQFFGKFCIIYLEAVEVL